MLLNAVFVEPVRCRRGHASNISHRVLVRRISIVLILNVSFIDAVSIIIGSHGDGRCGALVRVKCLSEALRLLHRLVIDVLRLDAICSLYIHVPYLVNIVALVRHVRTLVSNIVIA